MCRIVVGSQRWDRLAVTSNWADEGERSERPSEPQPTPSSPHPSKAHVEPQSDPSPGPSPTIPIPDLISEGSGGNLGTQAVEIKSLKAQVKKLKKQARPFILHHKAWLRTVKRKNQHKKKTWILMTHWTTLWPKMKGRLIKVDEKVKVTAQATQVLLGKMKVARKIQEEWEAEEERKRLTEEEATKTAISIEYDFIQARIEANRLLAEKVQEAEREQFTVEEREKFLHDTLATQRRILAHQRTESIRNKPLTKNYFDEIKALYEKVKRFDDSFITIAFSEDEKGFKEMNEGASDLNKKKKFFKGCLNYGTIDSEIMERKSFISKLDKVSSPEGDYLVVYRVNGNFRAFNYLMEVLHIFDRQDLFHLYDLVIKQYSESTPEGIELILWGDLKIMMESSIEVTDQGDFWNDSTRLEIVTWDSMAKSKANGVDYHQSKSRASDVECIVEDMLQKDSKRCLKNFRSDQDLSECLNTSSMEFKESTPKKHDVKQVQQSCLGEDC
ncbi:hypothetical protein Tco_0567513 [Tanacetum coccineum]